MKNRINRINEEIKREMGDIFKTLKDPRIPQIISTTKVDVSGDLSHAKIYVSVLDEDAEKIRETGEALNQAASYIRSEIGNRLKLRSTPKLHFIMDDSIKYAMHINDILKKL